MCLSVSSNLFCSEIEGWNVFVKSGIGFRAHLWVPDNYLLSYDDFILFIYNLVHKKYPSYQFSLIRKGFSSGYSGVWEVCGIKNEESVIFIIDGDNVAICANDEIRYASVEGATELFTI